MTTIDTAETKQCSLCRQDKPRDQFSKDRGRPDGLQYRCKECQRIMKGAKRRMRPAQSVLLGELAETHKQCSKCGETKPRSDFYRSRNLKDGYRPNCKACSAKPRRVPVTCPECGKKRTTVMTPATAGGVARCHSCATRSYRKDVSDVKPQSRGGFTVRYRIWNRDRWKVFATREEAARFRRGLLEAEAVKVNAKDPLAEAYSLIRKALAALSDAGLSQRGEDEATGPLYEAEDAVSALLRARYSKDAASTREAA